MGPGLGPSLSECHYVRVSVDIPGGTLWLPVGREAAPYPELQTGLGPISPTMPVKVVAAHKTMSFKLSSRAVSLNPASAITKENITLLQSIKSRSLSIHLKSNRPAQPFQLVQAAGCTQQLFAACSFDWSRPPEAWVSALWEGEMVVMVGMGMLLH